MTLDEIRPFVNKRCLAILHGDGENPVYGNLVVWDEAGGMIRFDRTFDMPESVRTNAMIHVSDVTHIELLT